MKRAIYYKTMIINIVMMRQNNFKISKIKNNLNNNYNNCNRIKIILIKWCKLFLRIKIIIIITPMSKIIFYSKTKIKTKLKFNNLNLWIKK